MFIKSLEKTSTPSYKLLKKGPQYVDNAELLAILFGAGTKQESCLDLAHRLLKTYSLPGLSSLSFSELQKECQGDYIKPLRLLSVFELCKRYNTLMATGESFSISSAQDVFHKFHFRFFNEKKEHFYALYLDSKNKILKEEELSIGIVNASLVHPREVFRPAIKEAAVSLIVLHNHPSGDPEPSDEDKQVTELLVKSGELLGINVLDHIIIGQNSYYSFADREQDFHSQ